MLMMMIIVIIIIIITIVEHVLGRKVTDNHTLLKTR